MLDTNVLYPARLRDLLLRLAMAGLFSARWTDEILDECFESLSADRPDLTRLDRTRHLMGVAAPDALIVGYEDLVDQIDLPDPDDRHVLAAAIAGGADLVVTWNVADFPGPATAGHDFSVVTPDELLVLLVEVDADVVLTVVGEQASNLRHPPMTTEELLGGLEQVGLTTGVGAVRARLGS